MSSLFAYDGRGGNTWGRATSTEQDNRTQVKYTDAFVRAWGVDAVSVDDYATDEVVTTLYATYGSGGSNWSRSSSTASTVTYSNTDGSVLVLSLDATAVSGGNGEGITDATIS